MPDFDTFYDCLGLRVIISWGDRHHPQKVGRLTKLEYVTGWGWFFALDGGRATQSLDGANWIVDATAT